jgi:hypothetical protein
MRLYYNSYCNLYRTRPVPWDLGTYKRGQERPARDTMRLSQDWFQVYSRYTIFALFVRSPTFEFIRRPLPSILSSSSRTFDDLTLSISTDHGNLGHQNDEFNAFFLPSKSNSKIEGNQITFGAIDFQPCKPTLAPVFANLDQYVCNVKLGSFCSWKSIHVWFEPLQTETRILLAVDFCNRKGNHVWLIGALPHAQI